MSQKTFFRSGPVLRLRKKIGRLLECAGTLWNAVRYRRADAVFIEGKEIRSGQAVRSFYFGNYRNFQWIFGKLYSEHEVREINRNVSVFSAGEWIKRYEGRSDLVVVDVEYLYCGKFDRDNPGYMRVPPWVRQKLDIGGMGEDVSASLRSRALNHELSKITRFGLTYRITTSREDHLKFYKDMYVPFTRKRFGDLADIKPRWKVLRQCRKGELMQIVRGGEVIAAGLLHLDQGRLSIVWIGISPDIDEEAYRGAFSAIYYYAILHGRRNGCGEADFLETRPSLNDGLFVFKRKWGTRLCESPVPRGDLFLRPASLDGPAANLFSGNYFITAGKDGLVGKILLNGERVSGKFVDHAVKHHWTEGLAALEIHSPDGVDPAAPERASASGRPVRVVDLSGEREPVKRFCGHPGSDRLSAGCGRESGASRNAPERAVTGRSR